MSPLFRLIPRVLLFVTLVVGSIPTGMAEMVCVFPSGPVLKQAATCSMPCCHGKTLHDPAEKLHECCTKSTKSASQIESAHDLTCQRVGPCQCEWRVSHGSQWDAVTKSIDLAHAYAHPVLCTAPGWSIPTCCLAEVGPGLFGIDSGPPRKIARTPSQPRAPPGFLI